MAKKYLDDAGLTYFWGKAKAYFLGGTSPDDVADTTNCPKMDGTKTYGTSHILAREDHVHPIDTSRASSTHTHGNITNSGDITATAPTIASGDKLIINDESASKITNGPSFGTDTTKYLRNDGTWATPDAGASTGVYWGSCDTAASTNAKTASITGFELETGVMVALYMSNGHTGSGTVSLNISSTGAKNILWYEETTLPAIAAGETLLLVYNGSNWDLLAIDGEACEHYSDFTGATSNASGAHGLVPQPTAGEQNKVLFGSGGWSNILLDNSVVLNVSSIRLSLMKNSLSGTTITYTDIPVADSSHPGAMSAADKAKLDSISMTNGVIDASVLPSYVDDIVEAYPRSGQTELGSTWLSATSGGSALTPETGKIYVLMGNSTNYSTNDLFRWSGSAFVKLSDGTGVSAMSTSEIDTAMAAA